MTIDFGRKLLPMTIGENMIIGDMINDVVVFGDDIHVLEVLVAQDIHVLVALS